MSGFQSDYEKARADLAAYKFDQVRMHLLALASEAVDLKEMFDGAGVDGEDFGRAFGDIANAIADGLNDAHTEIMNTRQALSLEPYRRAEIPEVKKITTRAVLPNNELWDGFKQAAG